MNILVIDDDSAIRKFIGVTLQKAAHTVFEVDNGKAGLEFLQGSPEIDVVITDLIMPEKEGIETIMEIHRQYPAIKIMAISGGGKVGPDNYLVLADALGAHTTLKKPFSGKELLMSLNLLQ
ncbi:MAG: response regulator [Chlorobium sp.]|uniref:response regulator n=1 Tax=Chlorobium sp. TaxID=1095 RepID=UPI0025BDF2E6|nr:response regulator [Chlorobium sp.]MCF8216585.1 response regulator [Chlorobium sp.]MCF8271455.1 response regulator [Chlorobium sp.]MCF8287827.1 response regulator [Chlorobium sp.]MCF8291389.1 response regulator [Chlorobium sp.]MCF8385496.1 response regulator [Chlorobium sp.]